MTYLDDNEVLFSNFCSQKQYSKRKLSACTHMYKHKTNTYTYTKRLLVYFFYLLSFLYEAVYCILCGNDL